jgi:hypothetical protein
MNLSYQNTTKSASQVASSASAATNSPQIPVIPTNFQLMPMSLMNHLMSGNKPELYSTWKHYNDYTNQNYSNYVQPQQQQHHHLNGNSSTTASNNSIQHQQQQQASAAAAAASTLSHLGMNPFLNPQKYASSIFETYLQSKAQTFQQNLNYSSHHLNATGGQHQQQQPAQYHNAGANNQQQHNLNYNQYIEEFKKPLSSFAALMQEAAANYQSNVFNSVKTFGEKMQQGNMSGGGGGGCSSVASDTSCASSVSSSSGLDSLKETQLKISESCSLVNESS